MHIPSGLGFPQDPHEELEGCGWEQGCLGQIATKWTWLQVLKMEGQMDEL